MQVGGVSLKQMKMIKYLKIACTSDGRQDEKTGSRIKQSKCCNASFAPFSDSVFVPIHT